MSEAGYDVDIHNSAGGDTGDDDDCNCQYDRQQDSGPHARNNAEINMTMTKKNKKKKKKKKKRMIQFQGRGNGGAGGLLEAKRLVLFPFAKAKKHFPHSNHTSSRKRPPSSTTSSADAVPKAPISCFPRAGNYKAGIIGSCFCLKQPSISESPVGSHSSDPNDPSFTLDKLKSLIEKNNFYSEDCNPHFDSNQ